MVSPAFPTAPGTLSNEEISLWDQLCTRIISLNERAWENRVGGIGVSNWLDNFSGATGRSRSVEQLHALYVLSEFMYFGSREIRVLLRSMYRDLFLVPLIQEIRSRQEDISDTKVLSALREELQRTRFMGVGNPSESGVHLLYYFRQENGLSKQAFMDSAQIYARKRRLWRWKNVLRQPEVQRYIFLDDLCGTGETAKTYSRDLLPDLISQKPDVDLRYYSLFACEEGMRVLRQETVFGPKCAAVFELDGTYKSVDVRSRYLFVRPSVIDPSLVRQMALTYGLRVWPAHPLGYLGGELLLGFSHNTPDNTLPIIWSEPQNGSTCPWTPIFRRYPKI